VGNHSCLPSDVELDEEAVEDIFFNWVDTRRHVLKDDYKFKGKDRKRTYELLTVLFIMDLV
jgi:hypothetical protein